MYRSNSARGPMAHTHFTMIPNSADDEGLDPYARSLLMHLFRVIGTDENGACWQSTTTLARICCMSRGRVSIAKRSLIARNLIRIEKRPGPGGLHDYITLVDPWGRNAAHFAGSSGQPKMRSPREPFLAGEDGCVHDVNALRSSGEPKKIPDTKNPTEEEDKGHSRKDQTPGNSRIASDDRASSDGFPPFGGSSATTLPEPQAGTVAVRWKGVRDALEVAIARPTFSRLIAGLRCLDIDDVTHTWRLHVDGPIAVGALSAPNMQTLLRRGFAAAGEGEVTVVWETAMSRGEMG